MRVRRLRCPICCWQCPRCSCTCGWPAWCLVSSQLLKMKAYDALYCIGCQVMGGVKCAWLPHSGLAHTQLCWLRQQLPADSHYGQKLQLR
jgi:hypothetical protein